MRWHVALAVGLVAWGTYSLTRTRSTLRRLVLDPTAPRNGRSRQNDPATASSKARQLPPPAVATEPSESSTTPTLIRVSWNVRVPEGTPANALIYICGNHPALGHWNPKGVALRFAENLFYRGDLRMPAGTSFEYKFTRGSWASVEVLKSGADRPNRILDLRSSAAVEDDVEAWADQI